MAYGADSAKEDVMSQAASTKRPLRVSLYKRDPYAWSLEQARLLREGRLDKVDAENVAEEILDVGRNEYDKLESALRVLLMHMLKWDYQAEKRTRSWENSIEIQRRHAMRQLRENPSLKSRTMEAVTDAYEDARRIASSETDKEVDESPGACPYDWDAILNRPFKR
jgi:hypothetical protein